MTLRVKKILHVEKSLFQDVLVFESTDHGNVLVLDGAIQVRILPLSAFVPADEDETDSVLAPAVRRARRVLVSLSRAALSSPASHSSLHPVSQRLAGTRR